jgi:hypothetical protein
MTQEAPESRRSALLVRDNYATPDVVRNHGRARPRVPFLSLVRLFLVAVPAAGLILGFAVLSFGRGTWSGWIWASSAAPVLLVLVLQIVTSLRRGVLASTLLRHYRWPQLWHLASIWPLRSSH